MELPEDVLAIVRAYSKPCFTYFREYNKTLTLLGKAAWPKLKEKLETEPASILPALLAYQMAVLRNKHMFKELMILRDRISFDESWEEQNRFYNMIFYTKKEVEDTFSVLIRLLHPEQNTYWALDGI
jgi:hypothetical protein